VLYNRITYTFRELENDPDLEQVVNTHTLTLPLPQIGSDWFRKPRFGSTMMKDLALVISPSTFNNHSPPTSPYSRVHS
jgi:hypothetical protein